jgi:hypothetical protein
METHTVANFLAEQFNEHAALLCPGVPKVVYVPCELACIPQEDGTRKFYMMVGAACLPQCAPMVTAVGFAPRW